MRTVTECVNYIATLIEHHNCYAEKNWTLTYIDGQFYVQTRHMNGRNPNDICAITREDMKSGLQPNKWAYITRSVAAILSKQKVRIPNAESKNHTENPVE